MARVAGGGPVNSTVVRLSYSQTMKRISLAIFIGLVVTCWFLLVGRYLRISGHSLATVNIFFPYSALVAFKFKNMWWFVSGSMFAQFPLYTMIISVGPLKRQRRIVIPLLMVVHGTVAIVALYLNPYGLAHYV